MGKLIAFNKPFKVLSQFTDSEQRSTLADFIPLHDCYAAGRLDYDSEGLMLLTNHGALQARIADPQHKLEKTYWVQVEGEASEEQLQTLRQGLLLKDGPTRTAKVRRISTPKGLWPRNPPIRVRQSIPDCWLEISISEGRNRQVRRMTAAVGLPTLRLIRAAIGPFHLHTLKLQPGQWQDVEVPDDLKPIKSRTAKPSNSAGKSAINNDRRRPARHKAKRPTKKSARAKTTSAKARTPSRTTKNSPAKSRVTKPSNRK